ncbi:hypothetical protein Hanom_Chr17g01579611 [Helianthus anomalus]
MTAAVGYRWRSELLLCVLDVVVWLVGRQGVVGDSGGGGKWR